MDPIKQLENRVKELERIISQMKSGNSFPFEIDKALEERGFSKTQFVMGYAEVGVAGSTTIPIPGANENSIVIVSVSYIPAVFEPIAGRLIFQNGSYCVYVEGVATTEFNYIVCLNAPIR